VGAAGAAAVGSAAASTAPALSKIIPWIAVAAAGVFLYAFCSKGNKPAEMAATNAPAPKVAAAPAPASAPAPAAPAPAAPAAPAATVPDAPKAPGSDVDLTVPDGAGTTASIVNGLPVLKAYFDTGKSDLSKDFNDKAKGLLDYLKKEATANAVVNGYHDPTGNKEQNQKLAKSRAEAVRDALVKQGIAIQRISLERPIETSGTGGSLAEARRVEVNVTK
jgi:outer membrane protein OmpA-like peptidoglycan-associated protein